MFLSYNYLLRPSKQQHAMLDFLLQQVRYVYNEALAQRIQAFQAEGLTLHYHDQRPYFQDLRNANKVTLGMLNSQTMVEALRRLEKAYEATFRRLKAGEKTGFPRFKNERRFRSLDFQYGNGCKLLIRSGGRAWFRVQNVGEIRMCYHRQIPDDAEIKHVILKRKSERWYACLICEFSDPQPILQQKNPIGIDVGLKALVAMSDGAIVKNPYWLQRNLSRLRVVQRRASRRKKGSHRRKKAYKLLGKFYSKIYNQRRDHLHNISRHLVNQYSMIAIEDLSLKFIQQCKRLGPASQDSGMAAFRRMLEYKAFAAGIQVVAVNPAYTSQRCSSCGKLVEKDLKTRVHACPFCGLVLDRDVNAARNILQIALLETNS